MNNKTIVSILRHGAYVLLLLALYVLQTVPFLFEIYGIKPNLLIPVAVIIAMLEGEFVGGIYGALAGLLCDMGGFSLFGLSGVVTMLCCVAVGLLVIYLLHSNLSGALLFVFCTVLFSTSLEYLFSYRIWGYENAWRIYAFYMLPRVFYSTAITPVLFLLVGKMHAKFSAAMAD